MEVGRVPGGSLRHGGRPRYAAAAGDVSMRVEGEGCDDDLGAPVAGVASQGSGSVGEFFVRNCVFDFIEITHYANLQTWDS